MLNKIEKYFFHYVLVVPALVLIVVLKVVPLIGALRLPFTDFDFFRGIEGSRWAGWRHFTQLWSDPYFWQVVWNTLGLKSSYLLLSGAAALILALVLSGIRSARVRSLFSSVFLVPYFIPTLVIAYLTMLLLSPDHSPLFRPNTFILGHPETWRMAFLAAEAVATCGIPAAVALAAIRAKETALAAGMAGTGFYSFFSHRFLPALRAVSAFTLLQVSVLLSVDYELVNALYHPLVYEAADTLNTFTYRTGLLSAEYSAAAAVWLMQFAIQLLLTLIAYGIVRTWFSRDLFSRYEPEEIRQLPAGRGVGAVAGWMIVLAYSAVVLVPLWFLAAYPFLAPGSPEIAAAGLLNPGRYMQSIGMTVLAVMVYMLMTLTLAYPLTARDLPGRMVYKLFLLLILTLGSGGIHEYLFYKELGLVNIAFTPVLSGMISVIGVFVLKSIFNSKYAEQKEQLSARGYGEMHAFFHLYIPKVWKPLIALGVLQFVTIWNAYSPSVVYINQPDLHTPVGVLYSLVMSGQSNPADMLKMGLAVSLPSLLLFLVFRRWLTSEVLINEVRNL